MTGWKPIPRHKLDSYLSLDTNRVADSMFQGSWDYRPRLLSVAAMQLMGCDRSQFWIGEDCVVELQLIDNFGVFFHRIGADGKHLGAGSTNINDA